MKTILIFVSLMILSSGVTNLMAFDSNALPESGTDKQLISEHRNDRLSVEEIQQLELRVFEIRDMDKSELTDEEKLELREELRDIRKAVQRPYIYIGGSTILLIILLIILLR
jgi:hypothetical protein